MTEHREATRRAKLRKSGTTYTWHRLNYCKKRALAQNKIQLSIITSSNIINDLNLQKIYIWKTYWKSTMVIMESMAELSYPDNSSNQIYKKPKMPKIIIEKLLKKIWVTHLHFLRHESQEQKFKYISESTLGYKFIINYITDIWRNNSFKNCKHRSTEVFTN